MIQFNPIISFIRSQFPGQNFIPLHEPNFIGKEKEYVNVAIDSTFVSSVGEFVNRFEEMICQYTGAGYAVATGNGTAALHIALLLAGVRPGDEVITQPFTFVATANAISYCNATPVFLDVDRDTMGLSPEALENFLRTETRNKNDSCYNRRTGKRITACVPMHTFGHPCRIGAIAEICRYHHLTLIEDAAESIGSTFKDRHTGRFGLLGIYSLNGNKTITCGGGGVIVTDDEKLAKQAKHLTTTAKRPHPYLYQHDEIGYNYRMPNLNAAMACAQLENLDVFLESKRKLAQTYLDFFEKFDTLSCFKEPKNCQSNYWLNAIILPDLKARDAFLDICSSNRVMARPAWDLLATLPMYSDCQTDGMENAQWFYERLVNIPSSARK